MKQNSCNVLTEQLQNFASGTCVDAYKFMGCHKESKGYVFRVWAPNAKGVS